jgi:hypothetical protein
MFGLPQAGIIAQELLAEGLSKHGYYQSKIIPGLWTHETRSAMFTLAVDDFAIKIKSENNGYHIINALKKYYTILVDKSAAKYIRLNIKWDYENGKVHMFMLGYLAKAMIQFKDETPTKIQNSLHRHIEIKYGAKQRMSMMKRCCPPPSKKMRQNCAGSGRHALVLCKSS